MADARAFQVFPGRAPQPGTPGSAASDAAAVLDLLVVVPTVPYPPVWGYGQRCFQLARQLARRHRVTMVCYSLVDQASDVADLAEYVHEVVAVLQRPAPSWRRRLGQIRSMCSRDPYHSRGVQTSAMQATVDELVRSRRIDAVIIESSQMGWLSVPASVPAYVDEHNIESELLERMARSEHSVLRRLFYQVEYRRYRRFEETVWGRSAGCAATSHRDASMITSRRPEVPVAVVPNGVDIEQFSPGSDEPVPSRLVFTGLLDYRPNYDGIRWFLEEVYPLVQGKHPSVELQIVGHGSPEVLRALRRPGVEVTGRVPDLRVHLNQAAVAVVPLRIGGGTRLKVVEAMSMGRAIVSTTLGADPNWVMRTCPQMRSCGDATQWRGVRRRRCQAGRTASQRAMANFSGQMDGKVSARRPLRQELGGSPHRILLLAHRPLTDASFGGGQRTSHILEAASDLGQVDTLAIHAGGAFSWSGWDCLLYTSPSPRDS